MAESDGQGYGAFIPKAQGSGSLALSKYPAARSSAVNGVGMRVIQRSKNAWMCSGPSVSQIACSRAGSEQLAKPLSSAVKAIPARSGLAFGPLVPVEALPELP